MYVVIGGEYMRIVANKYKYNEILRFIRESTGMNQKEFSHSLGIKYKTYQSYEQGRYNVNFKFVLDLAKLYEIEVIFEKKDNK